MRLDEDLYECIEAYNREDETFSEASEELIGGYSLFDFDGGLSEDEAERLRGSIEEANEAYAESFGEELDP